MITRGYKSEYAKTSKHLNAYCIFGPRGVPRGAQDEPKLGSSWLRKTSRKHLGNFSSHLDTVVASKGRSRSQLETLGGTTPRLPWPSRTSETIFFGGGSGRTVRDPENGPFSRTSSKTGAVQTVTYNPRRQTSHVWGSWRGVGK